MLVAIPTMRLLFSTIIRHSGAGRVAGLTSRAPVKSVHALHQKIMFATQVCRQCCHGLGRVWEEDVGKPNPLPWSLSEG
jgi:hypothetical protein